MLSSQGFDLWADGYDQSVGLTDEEGGYPFAGYKELLNRIYQRVLTRKSPRVLDIGFGTGTLAARLYQQGCVIFGQDFPPGCWKRLRPKCQKRSCIRGISAGDSCRSCKGRPSISSLLTIPFIT